MLRDFITVIDKNCRKFQYFKWDPGFLKAQNGELLFFYFIFYFGSDSGEIPQISHWSHSVLIRCFVYSDTDMGCLLIVFFLSVWLKILMNIRSWTQHKDLSLLTQTLLKYLRKQTLIMSKEESLSGGEEKQRDPLTLLNSINSQDLENTGEKKLDSCTWYYYHHDQESESRNRCSEKVSVLSTNLNVTLCGGKFTSLLRLSWLFCEGDDIQFSQNPSCGC